jgi:hypothetical protein
MRLAEYEESICPRHGVPKALCYSSTEPRMIEETIDYSERQLVRHAERERENPRRSKGWEDGHRFYIRPYDPKTDPPFKLRPTPEGPVGGSQVGDGSSSG